MKEIVVVYKSKTGFTKKYAEWIAEELSCDLMAISDFSLDSVTRYDMIIYGSRIHAGKLDGLTRVKEMTLNKDMVLFATGATPNDAEVIIEGIWQNTLKDGHMPHFYMQSGLDYKKMSMGDRLIMKTLAGFLSGKKKKNKEDIGCENAIKKSHDISSKDYIIPLVDYVKRVRSSYVE